MSGGTKLKKCMLHRFKREVICRLEDLLERRWHRKVEVEEVGFFDQFVESNTEPIEEFVAEDIPNLVDAELDIDFNDQLVGSDMEIVEHLVMDDPIAIGGDFYVLEHLVMRNDNFGVEFLSCIDGDLHIAANMNIFAIGVD